MNIHKAIFKLSIPAMVSFMLRTIYQVVDVYWIGKIGPEALAAISSTSFVLWALYSLSDLCVVGTTTLIAQCIGSKKYKEARFISGQGLVMITLFTVVFIIIGLAIYKRLFLWM
ncbi:MAG: hypothetical protein D6828_02520, partial [Nitrospirae bacterium]